MAFRLLTKRNILNQKYFQRLYISTTANNLNKNKIEGLDEDNSPIKYTATPASIWQAKFSRIGAVDTRLWYEPYVVLASISIFLIYFCILREESDIDIDLNKSIYKRIPGLEEHQLHVLLDYNKQHGLETEDIIARLQELKVQKDDVQ